MIGAMILLAFLLLGPLALLFGADSRVWDERGWWPGAARSSLPGGDWLQPETGIGVRKTVARVFQREVTSEVLPVCSAGCSVSAALPNQRVSSPPASPIDVGRGLHLGRRGEATGR